MEAFAITEVQPHVVSVHMASNNSDITTWTQAIHGPFQDKWWEAMKVEINTLKNDLHTWKLVTKMDWMTVLPCTWAFWIKQFPDGLMKKLKDWFLCSR